MVRSHHGICDTCAGRHRLLFVSSVVQYLLGNVYAMRLNKYVTARRRQLLSKITLDTGKLDGRSRLVARRNSSIMEALGGPPKSLVIRPVGFSANIHQIIYLEALQGMAPSPYSQAHTYLHRILAGADNK